MSVKRLLCTAAVIVEVTRSNDTELLRLSSPYGWISVKLTVVTGLISVYIVKSAPIKSSRADFARCGARKKGSEPPEQFLHASGRDDDGTNTFLHCLLSHKSLAAGGH